MDLMSIRRGLMAMASGRVRMASGEYTRTSGGVAYLTHNLGTKKIFVVMQRINDDHSNIDSSNQYMSVMVYGATVEALGLDEQQTYSLDNGTQAHFDSTNITANSAYPKGVNSYFPSATGSYPINGVMAYSDRGVTAMDSTFAPSDNVVRIYPVYGLYAGRWVWRAYALD